MVLSLSPRTSPDPTLCATRLWVRPLLQKAISAIVTFLPLTTGHAGSRKIPLSKEVPYDRLPFSRFLPF